MSSADDASSRGLSKQQIRVLFAVGLILGFAVGGAVAAFLDNSVPISDGVPLGASNGPSATVYGDGRVNMTDFASGSTLTLNTSGGNLSAYSNGNTYFDIYLDEFNGTETNVSDVQASTDLYIKPEDKAAVNITGSPSYVAWRNMSVGDGTVDFSYSASSSFELTVRTDGTDGVQYGAVKDAQDEGVAVDIAENGGELTFTLPAGTHDIRIRKLGTLYIYNETAVRQNGTLTDAELVDNVSVELRFFSDELTNSPGIFERNSSDGTVNMTGLPATEPFVIVVTAENYSNRRIFVPSLAETEEVFLLPTSAQSVTQQFVMRDFTGRFPAEYTVLEIQRALNGSWRTVEGDFFGATGEFSATMAYNSRHRLVLTNTNTGEERILGTYIPLASTTQTIDVAPNGTIVLKQVEIFFAADPSARRLPAANGTSVSVAVENRSTPLAYWNASAYLVNETGGETLVWQYNDTSEGTATNAFMLGNHAGERLRIELSATTTGGIVATKNVTFGLSETFANQDTSLLDVVGNLVALSSPTGRDAFTSFIAMALTVLLMGGVATQFRVSGETAGAIGVAALVAFAIIGFVSYDVVFVTAVALAAIIGLRRGL